MSRRIAVVWPSGRLPKTGGEQNLLAIVEHLDEAGHEVVSVVRPGPLGEALQRRGHTIARLRCLEPAGPLGWWGYLSAADLYSRAVRGECPFDIAGGELQRWSASRLARRAAGDAWREVVPPEGAELGELYRHRTSMPARFHDASNNQGNWWLALRHAATLRRTLERCESSFDWVFADLPQDAVAALTATDDRPERVGWYVQTAEPYQFGEAFLRAHVDTIVACGEYLADRFGGHANVRIIRNGVDTDEFRPDRDEVPPLLDELPERATIVGSVGALTPAKGHDDLLSAFVDVAREQSNPHLVVVGDGDLDYRRRLRRRAERAGVGDRVHFPGYVDDVESWLPNFDIFVLASRVEGIPLALTEAMSCGVASIATDIPGCRELAGQGAVQLVPPGDSDALAEALRQLVVSPDRRSELGRLARERAVEAFDVDRMLHEFREFFES